MADDSTTGTGTSTGEGSGTGTGAGESGGGTSREAQHSTGTEQREGAAGAAGTGDGGDGDGGDGRAAREAQALRAKLREAEQRAERLQRERESDAERTQRERDEAIKDRDRLQAQVRTLALETSVGRLATSMGVVDSIAAVRLIDGDLVEYDDDGRPSDKSVKAAMKDAIERHPFLTRSGDSDGGRKREAKDGKGEVSDFIRGRGRAA